MSASISPTSIRRARQDEAPALSAIAAASKAHWRYTAAELAGWRDDLTVRPETIATCPTYVIEQSSQLIGFCVLVPASPQWELGHFWIMPGAMRRGAGRALLAHALGVASELGAAGLIIDADPHAEAFYLSCGARRLGAVAAPLRGASDRTRPQLLLSVEPAAASLYHSDA